MTDPILELYEKNPGLSRAGDFHLETVEASTVPLKNYTPEEAAKLLGLNLKRNS